MILGIGIDSIEIARFIPWVHFSKHQLLRIFSEQEIAYACSCPAKTAERLAVRFAAREAFFKAYASMAPKSGLSFLAICKKVCVLSSNEGVPHLEVDWAALQQNGSVIKTHISITHTKTTATVVVILERA
jgi:holo-[acyl-carrier protein] synthase